jgi:hypothetical protein
VGQRWFRAKSQSHSLEWSISAQHVSSNFRVWTRFRLRGGDALKRIKQWQGALGAKIVVLHVETVRDRHAVTHSVKRGIYFGRAELLGVVPSDKAQLLLNIAPNLKLVWGCVRAAA